MSDELQACIDATLAAANHGEWAEALRCCTSSRSIEVAERVVPWVFDAMSSAEGVVPSHFDTLGAWMKQLDRVVRGGQRIPLDMKAHHTHT
jgi:hypothetical protein